MKNNLRIFQCLPSLAQCEVVRAKVWKCRYEGCNIIPSTASGRGSVRTEQDSECLVDIITALFLPLSGGGETKID